MSKLLLEIDESVCLYQGKYYTSYEGQNEFFDRYLRVFDAIKVVCRCEIVSSIGEEQKLICDKRITIVPVPMFKGIRKFIMAQGDIRKQLCNVAEGCDRGLLRIPSALASQTYRKLRKNKIPFSVEIVYDAKDGYKNANSLLERIAWIYQHRTMRRIANDAVGVSCVTEFYLQKHYFSKVAGSFSSNYSTLALPKAFYSLPRKFPRKDFYRISHIANQIIFKGRKGHKEVIDAIGILKERGYNVFVFFAGKDYHNGIAQLRQYAQKRNISDRVVFTGYLLRKDLETYLGSSDIFVMPTRSEGLPRVIIEAMAKGLPCLTTNVSGNSELITEDMMFDYDNPIELADKIERLITTSTLYEEVSKYNYERSLKYEASILERRRDEFYDKLKNWICK